MRGALQVVVRSGESCRLRMRLHTADGDVRRFEALVHAVRDEEGDPGGSEITGAVMAARDVTELRDREEQLEVAAHAFERMTEAMVITNAAGRILMVNQSYSRITGYAADEVVGRPENEFRTAMQPQAFYDEIYAAVLRTGHWDGTTWSRRRDGTVYHEWRSVSAVRDSEERISHFVTLFRELEQPGAPTARRPRRLKTKTFLASGSRSTLQRTKNDTSETWSCSRPIRRIPTTSIKSSIASGPVPAHTPVPEYIRLIAAGRYDDAYLVNWKSNVFPGILGRTCDRPCEPACRRGRVEDENLAKPEPVAICRLKRVAADFKDSKGNRSKNKPGIKKPNPTARKSPASAPARPRSPWRATSRRSATRSPCSTRTRSRAA